MSKSTNLIDGSGTGVYSYVDEGGFLRVQQSSYPPITDDDVQIVYRDFLTLNGNGTTTSMIVNASAANPSRFFIQSEPDFDIYIKNLSILIAGINNTSLFTLFGSINGLTNGCRLYYEDSNGEVIIGNELKNNYSLVNLCLGNPGFGVRFQQAAGNIANPLFLTNIDGNSEAIIPVLNFSDTFGLPYGIKLTNSTTNKLVFEIRDNLTVAAPNPLTQFNIIAYGFKRKIS